MKNTMKKVIIYSMAAIMQIGFGASVIEASPQHNDQYQEQKRYEAREYDHGQREHQMWKENDRHEREMKRRENEDEYKWHERQQHEIERHDQKARELREVALPYWQMNR